VTAPEARRSQWRTAVAVIVGGTLLRLVLAAFLPLFPDEAYYWVWSRNLAAGYFDHPPMIAWVIRFGTALVGDVPVGVRLGPVLCGSIASLAVASTARRIAGDDAALLAAVMMVVLPLAAAGLVLATPDAPLLAAFAVAMYTVVRAIGAPVRSRESTRWWLFAGIALGLAFSSKYTSILLPLGVVAAVVSHRDLRRRLLEPGPYLACIVAVVVFLPVLWWNARHDWISFRYQLEHGLGSSTVNVWRRLIRHEGDLLGGQLGLASPILVVMMAIAVAAGLRRRAAAERHLLASVSALTFLFFVYSAVRKHVEANWPAPAYVGAVALAAVHAWGDKGNRWLHHGVTLAGVLTALVYAHAVAPILPIPPARDPIARAFGWREVAAAAVNAASRTTDSSVTSWLGADRYQEAAEVAFYSRSARPTFAVNIEGRRNQFELWPGFPRRAARGDRLVLVLGDTRDPHPTVVALAPYFSSILRGEAVELRRDGGLVTTRRIYTLDGWTGGWPGAPTQAVSRRY
jgi:4-amino-4-deoxy-L-arabinose transferase-like glycosyltransferase